MRNSLTQIGISFAISLLVLGVFGIYHHITINGLEEQQQKLFAQLSDLLQQQAATTINQIENLNSSLGNRFDALETETELMDIQRKRDILMIQRDLNSTKKVVQSQLNFLSEEVVNVRAESESRFGELEETVQNIQVESQDFTAILDEVLEAVVSVSTDTGVGSGVIFDDRGYIVTNYHVLQGAQSLGVFTSDGNVHAARVVGVETNADLAILKIEGSFDALPFGDSDDVEVSQRVIAVGNPGGFDFTVTEGIISAKNRVGPNGVAYIQTDVPINPGNSGGPLVDNSGRIVGINTLKLAGFEGIGFAIPSNLVEDVTRQALALEEQ